MVPLPNKYITLYFEVMPCCIYFSHNLLQYVHFRNKSLSLSTATAPVYYFCYCFCHFCQGNISLERKPLETTHVETTESDGKTVLRKAEGLSCKQ